MPSGHAGTSPVFVCSQLHFHSREPTAKACFAPFRTRNPVLQTVQQNTQEIQAFYQRQGIATIFQSNPGNHHSHAVARTAAGITWLLRDA